VEIADQKLSGGLALMSVFDDSEICRSILENLPTGVCILDMQKKIILWSDGAERITGRTRYEVIGHSCIGEPLLHCDQPGCEWCNEDCPMARAMKTSHEADGLGFLHHKAGHQVPVHVRAVPVHDEHGSIIGAVGLFDSRLQQIGADQREDSRKFPGYIDPATEVASRAMIEGHLREALATFAEAQVPFGVLCFRLDGLEHFRASFGPEAASSLLRIVARTLEGALWRTDYVGRWSDDEFLVILNGCRDHALSSVRERLHRMLFREGIEWWGEKRSLPVLMGQATAQTDDSIELLVARAHKSLDADSGLAQGAVAGGAESSSGS
jgi:diguanylate cyclase (GGDEF)-like protein/PAS domain S-box-containing protein